MSEELEHIWSRVQAQLALAVDEPTYQLWLDPLRALQLDGDRLVIEVPAQSHRWIEDRFGRLIRAAVELVLGPTATIELQASCPPAAADRTIRSALGEAPRRVGPPLHCGSSPPPTANPLSNPKLNFDQFVIGDCNRLAHAAALTVAEMPAMAYNPLFICGPPGVGKTHLLSSIANLLSSHNPGLSVRCTTGEAFTNQFLSALADSRTEQFKARFRDIDVLLMDDVQFLERKAKTEEELFHTFNALHDCGRQIVLTSDRPPHDLQALEDRLRERFASGLVADIKPPELATRLAILRKRADHDHIALHDERALLLIADRVRSNVRALEGALIRVVAFSSLTGRALTAELAEEVLDGLYGHAAKTERSTRTVAEIQAATCQLFGLTIEELLSSSRTPRIAWPRQLAMYLTRELTRESLPAIGRHFGGRDHTTVMHAHKRTSVRLATDASSRESVQKLCTALDCHQP